MYLVIFSQDTVTVHTRKAPCYFAALQIHLDLLCEIFNNKSNAEGLNFLGDLELS